MRKWKKTTAQIFLKRESNRKIRSKPAIITMVLMVSIGILYSGLFIGDKLNEIVADNKRIAEDIVKEKLIRELRERTAVSNNLKEKLQAAHIVKEKKELALTTQHKRLQTLNLLLTELTKVSNKEESFGIAFSEARFKRNVIHPSAPNRVVGMGGVDLVFWGKRLKNQGIDPKGLLAIDYIYASYLKESSSKKEALEKYKGTINNRFSYNLTKKYIEILKDNKNFTKMLDAHLDSRELMSQL